LARDTELGLAEDRLLAAEGRLDEDPGPYGMYFINVDETGRRWLADRGLPARAPAPRE
jgi:hypothetical protein